MDMDPRTVLHFLKEVKEQRELTVEEIQLGKIAAKLFGQQVHEGAINAKKAYDKQVFEHLTTACGYTAQEARAEIALEERQSLFDRGFHGPRKRCRIGAPNCTIQHSHSDFVPLDYTPAYQLLGLA